MLVHGPHRSARKPLERKGRKTEGFCGIITGKEKSGVSWTDPDGKSTSTYLTCMSCDVSPLTGIGLWGSLTGNK